MGVFQGNVDHRDDPPRLIDAASHQAALSSNSISIEQLQTITSIDEATWDSLAPDDVFGSHGWLRTYEQTSHSARLVYFVARQSGSLVAAATCHMESRHRSGLNRLIYGRFSRAARLLGLSPSPNLICGSQFGLDQHVRVHPNVSPESRLQCITLLIDAMERFAQENGMTLCFRNVVDGRAPLDQILQRRQYLRAMEMPTTTMEIKWASFEEYHRQLRRDHPATAKNISREIRRASKMGVVFRKITGDIPDALCLHAILDAHSQRLNGVPFQFQPTFLQTLKRNLGSKVTAYVAMEGEDPIGVTLAIRAGDSVFLSIGGTDNTRAREARIYFNNSYNVPIEDAIASKAARIFCGKLLYDIKLRRGFGLIGLSAYLKLPSRLRSAIVAPAIRAQRARIENMLKNLQKRDDRTGDPA